MASVVRWRGTKEELLAELRVLPAVLAGRAPDPLGLSAAFLREIGTEILNQVKLDFLVKSAGGVGSDGVKWHPLKPETLERRRRKGFSGTDILEETAALLASLEPPVGSRSVPNQVFKGAPGKVELGTAIPYGMVHQYGTVHVVPRPFLPAGELPRAWEPAIEEAAERGLVKVLQMISDSGGVSE